MTGHDAATPFPHLTQSGDARMVDVSGKETTTREAEAVGRVLLSPDCVRALRDDTLPKGDALAVARIAGIQGAKLTPTIIPLCHPLMISKVDLEVTVTDEGCDIRSRVRVTGQTGVEMEALTAVSCAALALIDMVKAVDKHARITDVRVVAKSGGRSGDWRDES